MGSASNNVNPDLEDGTAHHPGLSKGTDDTPLNILRNTFGFQDFRGVQEQVIGRVMAGEHTLAVMPTGAGKSLCYQVPALALEGTALVISPLIALMHDQIRAAEAFGLRGGGADLGRRQPRRDDRAAPQGRARPALCRAGAGDGGGLSRADRAHSAGADRDRRGALRLGMGPRLPARLSAAACPCSTPSPTCRGWR